MAHANLIESDETVTARPSIPITVQGSFAYFSGA